MTNGARERFEVVDGAGIGSTVISCIDLVSIMETLLPAPYARSPLVLQSLDPPLFRLGGPGSMLSQVS